LIEEMKARFAAG